MLGQSNLSTASDKFRHERFVLIEFQVAKQTRFYNFEFPIVSNKVKRYKTENFIVFESNNKLNFNLMSSPSHRRWGLSFAAYRYFPTKLSQTLGKCHDMYKSLMTANRETDNEMTSETGKNKFEIDVSFLGLESSIEEVTCLRLAWDINRIGSHWILGSHLLFPSSQSHFIPTEQHFVDESEQNFRFAICMKFIWVVACENADEIVRSTESRLVNLHKIYELEDGKRKIWRILDFL